MSFNKFSVINDEEIIKAIKALKDDSSPGLEGISVKMLKLNVHSLIKPLSHIFNLGITTSTIPECFKISVITPIHKKGDKSNIENYRPISQISNIAKTLEKIIKKSPTLFNIHINQINNLNTHGKLVCYADDTVGTFCERPILG